MTRGVCIGRSLDLLDDGHQKKPCVKSISALRKYQGRVRLQPYRRKPVGSLLVVLLLDSGALPLRGLLGGKGSTSRAGLCSQSPPTHVMKCDVSGGIPGTSVQHSEMFSNRPEITISVWRLSSATFKAVFPSLSTALKSAPFSKSTLTTSL